jgi:tetratricopeptide (TPR) repeat protein
MQGRSLVPLWGTPAPPRVERVHYAETLSPRLSQKWGEQRALLDERWKYVHGPRPELYDLAADPHELHNLAAARPDQAAALRARLADFLARNSPPGGSRTLPVDDETRRQLQALGYLAAGGTGEQEIREELRSDGLAPQDRAGDISALGTARDMIEKGDPLPAREIARRLLVGAPDDPFYLEVLAVAELQLGRPDAALPAVERILAAGPSRGSAEQLLLQIGELRYNQGQRETGLRLMQRSLELKPTAEGFHLLASLHGAAGRRDEERAALERALAIDPRYAPARLDRAVRLAQQGQRAEARAELQRIVKDSPYFAKAQYNYGAFLLEEGATEQALPLFERAVTLEPGYAKARYATIALRLRLGRRGEAERALRELEAAVPGSPEAGQARRLFEETP